MRMPFNEPAAPAVCAWLAYCVTKTDERGTAVNGSRGS